MAGEKIRDADERTPRISRRDLARVCFRHKAKALLTFSGVIATAGLYCLVAADVFRSDAKLLVRLGRGNVSLDPTAASGQVMSVTQSQQSLINSEVEILRSRALATRVVRALGPETFLARGSAVPASNETSPAEDEAVETLLENLEVEALRGSNVVRVSCRARQPGIAQKVLAKVIEAYLDEHIGAHHAEGSHEFFVRETERVGQALAETEAKLRDLKNEASVGALEEQRRILLDRIGELEKERQRSTTGLAASAARIEGLRSTLASLPETLVTRETTGSSSAADAMRAKLYELQLKEQNYLSKFREESDPVREVRRQIAEAEALIEKEGRLQTQVTNELNPAHQRVKGDLMTEEAALSALRAKARALEDDLAAAEQQLKLLNDHEVQVAQLERQLLIHNDNYHRYAESTEQARIDEALKSEQISSISVVQPPTSLATPVGPPRLLVLLIGGILGSVAMLGVVVVSEFLDQTMSDPKQVEGILGLRSLMAIPALPMRRSSPASADRLPAWAITSMPADAGAEIVGPGPLVAAGGIQRSESLFEELVASADGALKSPCILAVTSCRRGEGVSTVAAWVAAALRLSGAGRVLLVDTEAIRRSGPGGRVVLPASAVRAWSDGGPDGHRSYVARTNAELLAHLRREADFVVLDTPPVLEKALALRLCGLADGTVLVVEAESTRWPVAREARKRLRLARAGLLGAVLNKRRLHIPGWLYRML